MNPNRVFQIVAGTFFFMATSSMHVAQAAPPTDACALVTPAQVSAVLGVTVGPGEHIAPSSTILCGFGSPNAQKRVVTEIITEAAFMNEKTPLKGISKESAPGIGDEAHYITTPGFGTGLSVRKGSFAFKVRVYGFPLDQIKVKEKALALNALANAKL
jgi:hypothetical protein